MILIKPALVGSLSFSLPLASHPFRPVPGKTLSLPMACSVLGATMIDPRAEEREAAASPIGIMGPQSAIFCMINWSEASS